MRRGDGRLFSMTRGEFGFRLKRVLLAGWSMERRKSIGADIPVILVISATTNPLRSDRMVNSQTVNGLSCSTPVMEFQTFLLRRKLICCLRRKDMVSPVAPPYLILNQYRNSVQNEE